MYFHGKIRILIRTKKRKKKDFLKGLFTRNSKENRPTDFLFSRKLLALCVTCRDRWSNSYNQSVATLPFIIQTQVQKSNVHT